MHLEINHFKNKLVAYYKRSHFLRFGLPFFILVIGGSFVLKDVQKIKLDYRKRRANEDDLRAQGVEIKKISIDEEYEKIKQADTNNWRNVRAPRPWEDNIEYLKAREMQDKRLEEMKKMEKREKKKSAARNNE